VPTRVELFLAHLDRLSGGVEPRFFPLRSTHPGMPGVTVIVYDDLPEPGMVTGVTYGGQPGQPSRVASRQTVLCISVRCSGLSWPLAVGHIAETQRRTNPFRYGDTISFGETIAPTSPMTAFAIFAPAVLGRRDYAGIDVGDPLPVNIAGLYSIHETERRDLHAHGPKAFWDLYDTDRPPAA
jgi:hypothetical protein